MLASTIPQVHARSLPANPSLDYRLNPVATIFSDLERRGIECWPTAVQAPEIHIFEEVKLTKIKRRHLGALSGLLVFLAVFAVACGGEPTPVPTTAAAPQAGGLKP